MKPTVFNGRVLNYGFYRFNLFGADWVLTYSLKIYIIRGVNSPKI